MALNTQRWLPDTCPGFPLTGCSVLVQYDNVSRVFTPSVAERKCSAHAGLATAANVYSACMNENLARAAALALANRTINGGNENETLRNYLFERSWHDPVTRALTVHMPSTVTTTQLNAIRTALSGITVVRDG